MFIDTLLTLKHNYFNRQHLLLIVGCISATPTKPRTIVSTLQLKQLGLKVQHCGKLK